MSIDACQIQVMDINQAYDMIAGSEREPVTAMVDALHTQLSTLGYRNADYAPVLIRNHVAKRNSTGAPLATPETASATAIELATLATGVAPVATAPAAPQNPGEPLTAPAPQAAAPDQPQAGAAPASATATPTPAATPAPAAEPAQSAAPTPAFRACGFAGIVLDADNADAIDATLQAVTAGRVKSIKGILEAIGAAETAVADLLQAQRLADAKLALLRDGRAEDAEQIEIAVPAFRPCGLLTNVTPSGPQLASLRMLLRGATNGAVPDFADLGGALAAAEGEAQRQGVALRDRIRDIKAASPRKPRAAAECAQEPAGLPDLDYDIVMRRASDIFLNAAFGTNVPILEFDVPTIVWSGKHPDVPDIDPSFRFYAPVLADLLDCVVEGEIPWLYGDSGCGKSEAFMQVAARLGFPLIRLNMDSHLTRSDLVGTNRLVPGPTGAPVMRFIEGLVPRALSQPALLLIDEFDLCDPEITPVLQPVLEGRGLRLLEDGGRYVAPHDFCRIAITANTVGLGSENQMYLNAHEQSAATRDRVARYIQMPYLPADKELEVVMARVPDCDPEFARKMIAFANEVRKGYQLNEIHQIISTRTVQRACRRHARFAPLYNDDRESTLTTLDCVCLNRADSSSRSVMKGIIDALWVL